MLGNVGRSPQVEINAGRAITDDGETVFFETSETLDPRDLNTDSDVYAWRDGEMRLVSPGGVPGDARYLDNSADGSTVFFTTYERILPRQDTNSARDLYAARVGGGFPDLPESTVGAPPPSPPPGEAPGPPANGSQAGGDGDQVADRRPTLSAARIPAAALRRCARTGRLPLRVTLTGGGKVTVHAGAVVRGKRRTVGRESRAVRTTNRTTVQLVLRLSKAARAQLRRKGTLRLRISVSASRALESEQLTAVVRRPKGGR
jgi:hypothetical protein